MTLSQEHLVRVIENSVISMCHKGTFYFGSSDYDSLSTLIDEWRDSIISSRSNEDQHVIAIPFTKRSLVWPYYSYGNIDSLCFFSSLELGVWITYLATGSYSHLWDIGAHHGIDSAVMALMTGCNVVHSFEPDPVAFDVLKSVVSLNSLSDVVTPANVGISHTNSSLPFLRVHGNTTASHFKGMRPYHGAVSEYVAQLHSYQNYEIPQYAKINIEGYEKELFPRFSSTFLKHVNMCIEVHSYDDMAAIHEACQKHSLSIYTQSSGFRFCDSFEDMPKSNKEGYVYITASRLPSVIDVDRLNTAARTYHCFQSYAPK